MEGGEKRGFECGKLLLQEVLTFYGEGRSSKETAMVTTSVETSALMSLFLKSTSLLPKSLQCLF